MCYILLQAAKQCATFCYMLPYCRRAACWPPPQSSSPNAAECSDRPPGSPRPRPLALLWSSASPIWSCICILPNSEGLMGAPHTAPGQLKGSHQRLPSLPSWDSHWGSHHGRRREGDGSTGPQLGSIFIIFVNGKLVSGEILSKWMDV